jgi:CRISPR-associated protein Csx17
MSVHVHKLEGCAPTPLAHYLKALAILRLVSEQRDPQARGWWKEEAFWLATKLSREDLLRFFLEEYEPTPILSPWNGGSGFYYERDPGLTPIETSSAPRFAAFRVGIAAARAVCGPLSESIALLKEKEARAKVAGKEDASAAADLKSARAEKDRHKEELLGACRRSWRGGLLEWFDAALVLDTSASPSWPALLGSGGNDGRLDFTNNSMQHLAAIFDCAAPLAPAVPAAVPLLLASLFAEPARGLSAMAVGQFFPGSAGGDNMGAGFSGEAAANPWDFVFTLEGAVLLASSVVRSTDAAELPQAAAPFAVRSSGAGYGSAGSADEGPRGEQWMPVWAGPALHAEVSALFSEGRIRAGRATSTRALDSARGLARLGAARGVTHFERYGYIERNGQSNLAVPLGRWETASRAREELLDDVDPWLRRLRSFARDKVAPRSVVAASRLIDEAILSICRSATDPLLWQSLLVALGSAEAAIAQSRSKAGDPKRGLGPLPTLRPQWLEAVDDGSTELRLAIALASQDVVLHRGSAQVVSNVRAHWVPLDRALAIRRSHDVRRPARFATNSAGLASDVDVVCSRGTLEDDLRRLVRRRIQLAPTLTARGLGMSGARGSEAPLADVMAFLFCNVDDARVLALARPLMAVAWWERDRPRIDRPVPSGVDAAFAVARIAHVSEPLDVGDKLTIELDPEPVARLSAGDLAGAITVCLRRLRASGLLPTVRVVAGGPSYARRLAASLAFPISPADATRCAQLISKPHEVKESVHGD